MCRGAICCCYNFFAKSINNFHHIYKAGANVIFLHGCVGECGKKVWGLEDAGTVCEFCGTNRFDDKGNPREFIIWFPLAERLKSLLQCDQYVEALRWEHERKKNAAYITGLYNQGEHENKRLHTHICFRLRAERLGLNSLRDEPGGTRKKTVARPYLFSFTG